MVGDALQALADEHELEGAADRAGLLDHVAAELAVELLVEDVHLLVALHHGDGLGVVGVQKALERVSQHLDRDGRHARNVHIGLQRRFGGELDRALGDVGRLVAHALEVVRGLHADDDEPQLGRDRRAQVHVADGLGIDPFFQFVELVVGLDHALGELDVAGHEGLERVAHLADRDLAHAEEIGAEGFEFGVKEAFHFSEG